MGCEPNKNYKLIIFLKVINCHPLAPNNIMIKEVVSK